MMHKIFITFLTALLVLLVSTGGGSAHQVEVENISGVQSAALSSSASVGTAFTYQGHLSDGDSSANGSYDFRFKLFNASSDGAQVGDTIKKNAVSVVDGFFTVTLNFGSVFSGTALYLDIGVRPAGSSTYTTLSPRQALTAAPYASYALSAPWSGLSGVPSGLDNGDDDTTYQAGSGLTLSADKFSVNFAGSGIANAASRSDHDHLGQTWENDDAILLFGGGDGVRSTAFGDGIIGNTFSSDKYGGVFTNISHLLGTGAGGPALYALSSGDGYPDIVLGGNTGTYDNGTIKSDPKFSTSDIVLYTNDHLHIHLDEVNANESSFAIKNGENNTVFSVSESGNVRADGTYYCPGPCVIQNGSADFAEMLPSVRELEPGDVLIIGSDGLLALSTQPYQASVVGVYSTQPGYLGGGEFMGQDGFVPLAVAGVVPVKVSAENGPIQPGDLLTTSATPGHAMRCEGVETCFGRTIGKALDGLENGKDVIRMLVVLQ
jgi:hypothetical protein